MRSPMISNANYIKPEEKSEYSELKVMNSAAGYYVGTTHTDPEYGFEEPGSRDSDYFRTHEEAQAFLDSLNSFEDADTASLVLRNHP